MLIHSSKESYIPIITIEDPRATVPESKIGFVTEQVTKQSYFVSVLLTLSLKNNIIVS